MTGVAELPAGLWIAPDRKRYERWSGRVHRLLGDPSHLAPLVLLADADDPTQLAGALDALTRGVRADLRYPVVVFLDGQDPNVTSSFDRALSLVDKIVQQVPTLRGVMRLFVVLSVAETYDPHEQEIVAAAQAHQSVLHVLLVSRSLRDSVSLTPDELEVQSFDAALLATFTSEVDSLPRVSSKVHAVGVATVCFRAREIEHNITEEVRAGLVAQLISEPDVRGKAEDDTKVALAKILEEEAAIGHLQSSASGNLAEVAASVVVKDPVVARIRIEELPMRLRALLGRALRRWDAEAEPLLKTNTAALERRTRGEVADYFGGLIGAERGNLPAIERSLEVARLAVQERVADAESWLRMDPPGKQPEAIDQQLVDWIRHLSFGAGVIARSLSLATMCGALVWLNPFVWKMFRWLVLAVLPLPNPPDWSVSIGAAVMSYMVAVTAFHFAPIFWVSWLRRSYEKAILDRLRYLLGVRTRQSLISVLNAVDRDLAEFQGAVAVTRDTIENASTLRLRPIASSKYSVGIPHSLPEVDSDPTLESLLDHARSRFSGNAAMAWTVQAPSPLLSIDDSTPNNLLLEPLTVAMSGVLHDVDRLATNRPARTLAALLSSDRAITGQVAAILRRNVVPLVSGVEKWEAADLDETTGLRVVFPRRPDLAVWEDTFQLAEARSALPRFKAVGEHRNFAFTTVFLPMTVPGEPEGTS